MRLSAHRSFLAAALLAAGLPSLALAQANGPSPATKSTADHENRAPIPPVPPGVPTTPQNVQLPTESEVKLGRQGAVEVEKQYKLITSGPYYERLQRVAREVEAAILRPEIAEEYKREYHLPRSSDKSRRVPFEFSFKVVDDVKEINAFALAGGPVYVTRGLMDYAPSDHELAAVLAHECTHVVFHHVEQLVKKQKKANSTQLLTALAAVLAGMAGGGAAAEAAGNLIMAGQLVAIATLTGYGRELEAEADRVGVEALATTQYRPVAMLTFMQKLARDEKLRGNQDNGIFQDHPYSNERVAAIKKELQELGYRVDAGSQRQVSGSFRVEAIPQRLNGKQVAELRLNGNLLYIVAAGEDQSGPIPRAQKIAAQMQELFADNVTFNDVRQSTDKQILFLKGVPVLQVYSEDAAAMGVPTPTTDKAYKEIMRALWQEKLNTSQ